MTALLVDDFNIRLIALTMAIPPFAANSRVRRPQTSFGLSLVPVRLNLSLVLVAGTHLRAPLVTRLQLVALLLG